MITSASNAQVKRLVQLNKKAKLRRAENVFIIEGTRMFEETPRDRIEKVYVSESFYEKNPGCVSGLPNEILSDSVFLKAADTVAPQGIMAVVRRGELKREELLKKHNPFLLILDDLKDPGNLGTIMRTAEGAGVDAVIMSSDTVDIYTPKAVRATMGSIYRVPFIIETDLKSLLRELTSRGIRTYAAHLEGRKNYDEADYTGGCAFLIGNEGNGLRDEITDEATDRIIIPMKGSLESLNAAMAAGILMYEASRQRRKKH